MKSLKYLTRNENGAVAVTAVFVVMILLIGGGAALDYTRHVVAQSDLQEAADTAALTAAQEYRKKGWDKAHALGLSFFDVNRDEENPLVEVNDPSIVLTDAPSVRVSVTGKTSTTLMRVAGINEVEFEVVSEVFIPDFPVEIALVLDTTGSMRSGRKIQTLRSEASDFVDIVNPDFIDRVSISVIPFAQYVNVGRGQMGQSWLNAADYEEVHLDCIGVVCKQRIERHNWNGCVGSRLTPHNLTDSNYSNRIPGPVKPRLSCPSNEITPLTKDARAVKRAVNTLKPSGWTYIPAGVMWGLRTLSSQAPYTQALTPAARRAQEGLRFMVVMTDGDNTVSYRETTATVGSGRRRVQARFGEHSRRGFNLNNANQTTLKACEAVKSEEIEVFTIAFGTGISERTREMMKECATKEGNFYNATTNSALRETFQSIANKILNIYLSK